VTVTIYQILLTGLYGADNQRGTSRARAHGILGRYGTGPRRTQPWLTARSAPNHNFRT
jgi:hypothetical protein